MQIEVTVVEIITECPHILIDENSEKLFILKLGNNYLYAFSLSHVLNSTAA